MSKTSQKTEATLEGFLRGLAREQIRELEKQYPAVEHAVSFTRVVRIARGEVDATWEEKQHLEDCAECRSIAGRAKARMPEPTGGTSQRAPVLWGIPILVDAFVLGAKSGRSPLSELKTGVNLLSISDRETGTRHARIALRPAGKVVKIRHVEGEPLLLRETGEALGNEEFTELPARPDATVSEFLEGVLAMTRREGEGG